MLRAATDATKVPRQSNDVKRQSAKDKVINKHKVAKHFKLAIGDDTLSCPEVNGSQGVEEGSRMLSLLGADDRAYRASSRFVPLLRLPAQHSAGHGFVSRDRVGQSPADPGAHRAPDRSRLSRRQPWRHDGEIFAGTETVALTPPGAPSHGRLSS